MRKVVVYSCIKKTYFQLLLKLVGRECQHPTAGMVEYGDFLGSEEMLGNNDGTEGVRSVIIISL